MVKNVLKGIIEDSLDTSIQQVSGSDAAFLYAESPKSPMHIATLTIVDGSLNFKDFKAILASKLHLIPKFRKRLLNVPLNLDYPYWVDDPNFDLDLHLTRVKLPDPPNWSTLRELTSTIFSNPLDLRRPLWSISFIEGLDEIPQIPKGSVGIVTKVHHVMIDGSSGVGLMGVLFDKEPGNKKSKPPAPKPYEPEPLPDEISLLLKSSQSFFKNPLKIPRTLSETLFTVLKGKATGSGSGQLQFNKKSFTVPKTIFNGSISPKRTWGTALLSFERINVLRKIMEVSFNDMIVAICAGGIRRYLLEKDKLPSQSLVANVPISIRSKNQDQKLNNQISSMLVQIATHIADPIERIQYIQEQTTQGKNRHKAIGAKTLAKMADAVPFGLANLAAGIYSKYNIKELHRSPFNVTITNVPGPRGMLYLNGHKIVSMFGLTPVVDGFGLIIAAFSYNGQVSITTTSDSNTMPDVNVFSRYIRESANELEKIIQKRGKQKPTVAKQKKIQSAVFFTAFKKYLKQHTKDLKGLKGIYHLGLNEMNVASNWQLEITSNEASLKKMKGSKCNAKIIVNDTVLYKIYKGNLRLEEAKIQGRLKFEGSKKDVANLLKIITQFLNR